MKFNEKQSVKSNPAIQDLLNTDLIKIKGGSIKPSNFCNSTCVACTSGSAVSM